MSGSQKIRPQTCIASEYNFACEAEIMGLEGMMVNRGGFQWHLNAEGALSLEGLRVRHPPVHELSWSVGTWVQEPVNNAIL